MESETIDDILAELAQAPADVPLLQKLGGLYLLDRRVADAILTYEKALAISPNDPWTQLFLANVLCNKRRLQEALRLAKCAIETLPEMAIGYTSLGDIYKAQGRLDLADEAYQTAVRLQPDNEHARKKLSDWLAYRFDPKCSKRVSKGKRKPPKVRHTQPE